MFFPFFFLFETLKVKVEWGPDCAHPISGAGKQDVYSENIMDVPTLRLIVVFASLFGAMHFMTWSFSMPTTFELWMWRSASITLTSLPILGAILFFMADSLERHSSMSFLETLLAILGLACFVLHPVIRLIIAVDSVVLLRDLPDTAFLVLSWSDAMPSL